VSFIRKVIQLTVTQSQLLDSNDNPSVFDGPDANAPLIAVLWITPHTQLQSYMSSQTYLFISFVSDANTTCQGFNTTYYSITPGRSIRHLASTHIYTGAARLGGEVCSAQNRMERYATGNDS